MKWLIDAQLPRRLAIWLVTQRHDARHTLDLPLRNRTADSDIITLADQEDRVVVTKDNDFVQSFLVNDQPYRLLLIATGNISNVELEQRIAANLDKIIQAFEQYRFVELGQKVLVIHQ